MEQMHLVNVQGQRVLHKFVSLENCTQTDLVNVPRTVHFSAANFERYSSAHLQQLLTLKSTFSWFLPSWATIFSRILAPHTHREELLAEAARPAAALAHVGGAEVAVAARDGRAARHVVGDVHAQRRCNRQTERQGVNELGEQFSCHFHIHEACTSFHGLRGTFSLSNMSAKEPSYMMDKPRQITSAPALRRPCSHVFVWEGGERKAVRPHRTNSIL